jgi:hypothetical protein
MALMIECCDGWLCNKSGEIGARQGANRSQVEHLARICNTVWRLFSSSFVPSSMKHYTSFKPLAPRERRGDKPCYLTTTLWTSAKSAHRLRDIRIGKCHSRGNGNPGCSKQPGFQPPDFPAAFCHESVGWLRHDQGLVVYSTLALCHLMKLINHLYLQHEHHRMVTQGSEAASQDCRQMKATKHLLRSATSRKLAGLLG